MGIEITRCIGDLSVSLHNFRSQGVQRVAFTRQNSNYFEAKEFLLLEEFGESLLAQRELVNKIARSSAMPCRAHS